MTGLCRRPELGMAIAAVCETIWERSRYRSKLLVTANRQLVPQLSPSMKQEIPQCM